LLRMTDERSNPGDIRTEGKRPLRKKSNKEDSKGGDDSGSLKT